MNETPPALPPQSPAPTPMSLAARLLNVFATPGEVFDDVKASAHRAANWLVPALLTALVGAVAVWILFSQPAVLQKVREQQEQTLDKMYEKPLKEGKMSQQDVERAKEMAQKFSGPTMMKISGAVGAVFWAFVRLFALAVVLWAVGRLFLRSPFDYMKAAEVVGLAAMISVLGTIVKLLLQVNFSDPASSPSFALVVGQFDPKNPLHTLLAMLNLFDFWELAVMTIGVARLAGVPFARAGVPMFGFWAIWSLIKVVFTAGMARLFG